MLKRILISLIAIIFFSSTICNSICILSSLHSEKSNTISCHYHNNQTLKTKKEQIKTFNSTFCDFLHDDIKNSLIVNHLFFPVSNKENIYLPQTLITLPSKVSFIRHSPTPPLYILLLNLRI